MRLAALALLVLPLFPAMAQAPEPAANPLATALKNLYTGNRNNIVRSAEKMPEEFYGMRPGQQMEVRTFAQQIGHVARYNFLWCSQAKGEKNPNTADLEKIPGKADVLKALTDAFAYCDAVYNTLTDAAMMETVNITQESGRQTKNVRGFLLMLNYGHNNEIYGSIVTSLRMKNIVPPASEPRPVAAAPKH